MRRIFLILAAVAALSVGVFASTAQADHGHYRRYGGYGGGWGHHDHCYPGYSYYRPNRSYYGGHHHHGHHHHHRYGGSRYYGGGLGIYIGF